MKVSWLGDSAVLVDDVEPAQRPGLKKHLENRLGDVAVRLGMRSLLVSSRQPDPSLLVRTDTALLGVQDVSVAATQGRHIEIPTVFDGEDLGAVAALLELQTQEFVQRFTDINWRVALIGFAPGFPYLVPTSGNSFVNDIARLDTPRPRVPEGAVAIAAGMAAVYPSAMPGGWRILGSTSLRMFDAQAEPPSLLHINDTVRFVEASQ